VKKIADEFADYCEWYYEKNPDAPDRGGQEFNAEYVKQHPLLSKEERSWAPQAFRDVELWMGFNTDDCSSKHLSYFITERNLYITGGYDRLVNHIGRPLQKENCILMGHVVSKIENLVDHDKVVLHSTNSKGEDLQYEGDAVIVTVPLGVLKQRMISFDPPLGPKYDQAVDKYSVAALGKHSWNSMKSFG
jgi:polyamine oxidase